MPVVGRPVLFPFSFALFLPSDFTMAFVLIPPYLLNKRSSKSDKWGAGQMRKRE